MFTLLNITIAVVLGIAAVYITWRQGKARERGYAVYVVRNDGKVVMWDGGGDRK